MGKVLPEDAASGRSGGLSQRGGHTGLAPSPLCWGAWHAATLCKHQAPPVALLLALPNLLLGGGS